MTYIDLKSLVAVFVGSVLVANGYRMKLSCIMSGILTIFVISVLVRNGDEKRERVPVAQQRGHTQKKNGGPKK